MTRSDLYIVLAFGLLIVAIIELMAPGSPR